MAPAFTWQSMACTWPKSFLSEIGTSLVLKAVAADVGRRSLLCVSGFLKGGARDELCRPLVFGYWQVFAGERFHFTARHGGALLAQCLVGPYS